MPSISIDTTDAMELTEVLQFIAGWISSDRAGLESSLLAYVGHPAYGTAHLQQDLHRFTFLLGGSDGEPLFDPGQD
jgi:hypothetical protein